MFLESVNDFKRNEGAKIGRTDQTPILVLAVSAVLSNPRAACCLPTDFMRPSSAG